MTAKEFFKKRSHNFRVAGLFIKKYSIVYLILTGLIASYEAFMDVRRFMLYGIAERISLWYFLSRIFIFVPTVIAFVLILVNMIKKDRFSDRFFSWMLYIYVLFAMAYATFVAILDASTGGYPITFMTTMIVVGGIATINPIFYFLVCAGSVALLQVYGLSNSVLDPNEYFHFGVFIVMSLLLAFRIYQVTMSETYLREKLEEQNNTDQLTGVGNERLYLETIKTLDEKYLDYAVVAMDLNNLKATNDKYGHQYGCHLVVEAGHQLPKIFPHSLLFHVGGDEYIAILVNEDYMNRMSLFNDFAQKMSYQEVEFEGATIILSLAMGYAERYGSTYKETFHLADMRMYENKVKLKAQYNFKSVR